MLDHVGTVFDCASVVLKCVSAVLDHMSAMLACVGSLYHHISAILDGVPWINDCARKGIYPGMAFIPRLDKSLRL